MLVMPPTVPARCAGTDSFANGKVSIAAPEASATHMRIAMRAASASPGTSTTVAHRRADPMIPAAMGPLRRPSRWEIAAKARPPRAHTISMAEATRAAARAENPYCETRNGTPHRPAKARTIPERAPGTTSIAHVLRYRKTARSWEAIDGAPAPWVSVAK